MAASAQSLQASSAGALLRLWRSSLGKKYVMAITGLGLWVFVIIHMLGNLQIFLGPEKIDSYAALLKSNPAILWPARIGLFLIAALHVLTAEQLVRANRRARPKGYEFKKPVASTFANRTMLLSGLVIFSFILFHLAHFTMGWINPQLLRLKDAQGRHDVYQMMVKGFSKDSPNIRQQDYFYTHDSQLYAIRFSLAQDEWEQGKFVIKDVVGQLSME